MIENLVKCLKCGECVSPEYMKVHVRLCDPGFGRLKEEMLRKLGRTRGSMGSKAAGSIELAWRRGREKGRAEGYVLGYKDAKARRKARHD